MLCAVVRAQALGKKERSKYDDLVELVSEENNRHRLREFMNKVQLPCIPYLGVPLAQHCFTYIVYRYVHIVQSVLRSAVLHN